MTYLPIPQAGSAGSGVVTASVDNSVANFGASPFAVSNNATGELFTEGYLTDFLNLLNVGTSPPTT